MSEEKHPYMYIVIRRDIPVDKWPIAIGHAAHEAVAEVIDTYVYRHYDNSGNSPIILSSLEEVKQDLIIASRTDCNLVLCGVDNEQQLLEWADKIEKKGIIVARVVEPDPPFNGAVIAIGVQPCITNKVRKTCFMLKLPTDDEVVGTWRQTKHSGAYSGDQKKKLLTKVRNFLMQ